MSIFEFDLKTLVFFIFIFEIKNSDNGDVYKDKDKIFINLQRMNFE